MTDALEVLMEVHEEEQLEMSVGEEEEIDMSVGEVTEGGGEAVKDYRVLTHKPSINTHVLNGDSNFEDIGLHFMTNVELKQLLGG